MLIPAPDPWEDGNDTEPAATAGQIGRAIDNWLRATLEHQETGSERTRADMVEAERRLAAFERWLLSQIRNPAKFHREIGGYE